MRKARFFGIIMAFVLLLPAVALCAAGSGVMRLFSSADAGFSTREYIVRFSGDAPEQDIRLFRNARNACAISESDRIFFVRMTPEEAEDLGDAFGEKMIYCSENLERSIATANMDPDLQTADFAEQVRLPEAWEAVEPDPDLIIAVLDTGVLRGHEDFVGVRILEGYDAVEKHRGVHQDTSGHGTATVGVIAAARNGVGSTGICPGVQILPVRVSRSENVIYSSDFVSGLRFAVDAGAKIINMSFGGYSFSAAENDAVRYALSRQCILIAAAGNDGRTAHGSDESYPASYEGVISVGSCDRFGNRSAFSQNSKNVFILAPGEQIPVPAIDPEGESYYRKANGTSLSAAILTGIAGLALSALDDGVRFGQEEMKSLLSRGEQPEPGYGCGVADAFLAVSEVNQPQITGVLPGKTYNSRVSVRFNRGSAMLDGEEFFDGDTVYQNGTHSLVVQDGTNRKAVIFRLTYVPASYEVRREGNSLSVVFRGAEGTMDGLPYASGEPVTGRGYHRFVMTDEFGEETEALLSFEPDLPSVSGVSDGMTYDRPVRILVSGAGAARLNGELLEGPAVLSENGAYELRLSARDRNVESVVSFVIERHENAVGLDLADADPASEILIGPDGGWIAEYGAVPGLRIYDPETGELILDYGSEVVRKAGAFGEKLLIFDGERLISAALEELSAAEPEPAFPSVYCDDFAIENGRLWILSGGRVSEWDPVSDELTASAFEGDRLIPAGGAAYLLSHDRNELTDLSDGTVFSLPALSGEQFMIRERTLFLNGTAYALGETLVPLFEYGGSALETYEGHLYTDEAVYSLEDGSLAGRMGVRPSALIFSGEKVFLRTDSGELRTVPGARQLFAPVPETLALPPVRTSAYVRTYEWFDRSSGDRLFGSERVFAVLLRNARRVLVYGGGELISEYALPFAPASAALDGDSVAVTSEDGKMLFLNGRTFVPGVSVKKLFFAGHALHLFDGRSVYLFDGSAAVDTGIRADDAAGSGDLTVWTKDGILSGAAGETEFSVDAGEKGEILLTDGEFASAGQTVCRFTANGWEEIGYADARPVSMASGCMLTEGGLTDMGTMTVLRAFDASGCEDAVLSRECGVLFLTSDGNVIQCVSEEAETGVMPFWKAPEPSGCANGTLYRESTVIGYVAGTGVLDGKRIPSGFAVTEPGEHVFRLVLPCGLERRSVFRVIPGLEGIAFLHPEIRLSVNETGTLPVIYLPAEASRVSVFYRADSDCIQLNGDGSFRAVKEGTANVTAATEEGKHIATCVVRVTSALLRFRTDSGYLADRAYGLLLGVPEAASKETIEESVISAGRVSFSTENVGTGTVVRLHAEDGSVLDELEIVIRGDVDGDGYVTLHDMTVLERLLESGENPGAAVLAAADADDSGSVTSRDLNRLQSRILFDRGYGKRELPPVLEDGEAVLLAPALIEEGETVRVLIGLKDCDGANGVSGRLTFDTNRWTYEGYESHGWGMTVTENRSGQVAFLGSGQPAKDMHPVVSLFFRPLRGEIDPPEMSELLLRDVTIIRLEDARSLERKTLKAEPRRKSYGEINIAANGMEPFSPERQTYDLSLPYDTFFVDLSLTYPENYKAEIIDPVFVKSNRLDVTVRFVSPEGEESVYTVRAYRDGIRPKNGNSELASLSVEGYEIGFSPDRTEYRLTVPRGTTGLTVRCAPADRRAAYEITGTAFNTASEENTVRIRVTAEDGSETVYTIIARYEDEKDHESEQSAPGDDEQSDPGPALWIVAFASVAAVAGSAALLFRKRKPTDGTNGGE